MYSEFFQFIQVFLINVVIISVVYLTYLNYSTTLHWKKRNVPYLPAKRLFSKGALESFLVTYSQLKEIYYSSDSVCVGFFQFRKPTLLLRSPEVINRILNKDFKCFADKRSAECTEGSRDPLEQHLLALSGNKWSYLRSKLTPSFTPDKLRNMFPILQKCVDNFIAEVGHSGDSPVAAKDLCGRLSMDCIASCAFGLELNCLKNQNETFIQMSSEPFKAGFWPNLKSQIRIAHPRIFKALRLSPYKQHVSAFFCSLVQTLIELKKESINPHVDFVYVLMKLLEEDELKTDESPFTINLGELISAQVFSFFVGGYETTSLTMSNALFEIAMHDEVKRQIMEEIDAVIPDGHITYEHANSLKYLSSVIDEVLRLHPPVYCIQRVSCQDYHIADSEVTIEKGMEVLIPVRELHHDPLYFPQPDNFHPDRFSVANKANIVKGTYLPFGDGPRHCIGFRFSLLELKVSLAKLLRDFDVSLDPSSPSSLVFQEYSRVYKSKDEIFLKFTKRQRNK